MQKGLMYGRAVLSIVRVSARAAPATCLIASNFNTFCVNNNFTFLTNTTSYAPVDDVIKNTRITPGGSTKHIYASCPNDSLGICCAKYLQVTA